MKRKQFLNIVAVTTASLATFSIFESCNRDKVQQIDFTVDLDDPANFDLTTLGGYKVFNSAVIVANDTSNNYIAFSALCTYDACLIEFDTTNEFICPCCQSHYNTDGIVIFGSAASALTKYNVQKINNILRVYS